MTQEEREIIANNCLHWNECTYPCENCPIFKKMFKLCISQEEKELLLKDISGRIPYQPMCEFTDTEDVFCKTTEKLGYSLHDFVAGKIVIKPYLRPMSSMTEKENEEYCNLQDRFLCSSQYPVTDAYEIFDWLNAHHFDYRGIIPMGLGIDCTGLNIYENE